MDEELKTYFRQLEDRMVSMEGRLNGQMALMEDRLNARIDEVKIYVNERCERVETALLTEFHKWASPLQKRVNSHSAVLRALDAELESLKERVERLEGGSPNKPH